MLWLWSAMEAALLAVLIFQMAAPLKSAAAELESQTAEFEEDGEPTEEAETDGEQIAFMFTWTQTPGSRPSVSFKGRPIGAIGSRGAMKRGAALVSSEMQQRNGMGGPLRC